MGNKFWFLDLLPQKPTWEWKITILIGNREGKISYQFVADIWSTKNRLVKHRFSRNVTGDLRDMWVLITLVSSLLSLLDFIQT